MVTLRFCTMTSDHLLTLRLFFTFTTKWSRDIHSAVFAQVSLTNLFEQLYKSCCNSVSTPTLNSEWTACANSFFLKHSTLLAISTFVTIKLELKFPHPSKQRRTIFALFIHLNLFHSFKLNLLYIWIGTSDRISLNMMRRHPTQRWVLTVKTQIKIGCLVTNGDVHTFCPSIRLTGQERNPLFYI